MRTRSLVRWGLLLATGAVLAPAQAAAATPLFVDRASLGGRCDDGRPAGAVTAATPWCSLARAVAAAPADSVVSIRGGQYPELRVAGSRGRAITFVRFRGEPVTVDGISVTDSDHLAFEGLRLTRGAAVVGASRHLRFSHNVVDLQGPGTGFDIRGTSAGDAEHIVVEGNTIEDVRENGDGTTGYGVRAASKVDHITIRRNTIKHVQVDGIQVSGVENLVIDGNEIAHARKAPGSDAHADPIQVYAPDGHSAIIRNNYVHDNAHAILVHAGQLGLVVENNVLVRNGMMGIKVGNAPGARFVNNTVWDNEHGGVELRDDIDLPFTGVVFANNLVQSVSGASFSVFDHNVLGSGERRGAHDMIASPRFDGNYELLEGSAGIDDAAPGLAPPRDRLGRGRRGAPDRGALEHKGILAAAGTPPAPESPQGGERTGAPAVVVPAGQRRRGPRLFARRGLVLGITCPVDCRARVQARLGRGTARRLDLRPRRRVGHAVERLRAGRPERVRVRLNPRVARRVRGLRRATIRLRVAIVSADGHRSVARRTVRLRRR